MCTVIALASRGASAYLCRARSPSCAVSASIVRCAGSYGGRKRSVTSMQHPEAGSPGEIPVLDGFLALHKPEEWTSNDVVKKVGSTSFQLGLDPGFRFKARRVVVQVRGVLERAMRQMIGQKVNVKVCHARFVWPRPASTSSITGDYSCDAPAHWHWDRSATGARWIQWLRAFWCLGLGLAVRRWRLISR